jgi:hypothetical protein
VAVSLSWSAMAQAIRSSPEMRYETKTVAFAVAIEVFRRMAGVSLYKFSVVGACVYIFGNGLNAKLFDVALNKCSPDRSEQLRSWTIVAGTVSRSLSRVLWGHAALTAVSCVCGSQILLINKLTALIPIVMWGLSPYEDETTRFATLALNERRWSLVHNFMRNRPIRHHIAPTINCPSMDDFSLLAEDPVRYCFEHSKFVGEWTGRRREIFTHFFTEEKMSWFSIRIANAEAVWNGDWRSLIKQCAERLAHKEGLKFEEQPDEYKAAYQSIAISADLLMNAIQVLYEDPDFELDNQKSVHQQLLEHAEIIFRKMHPLQDASSGGVTGFTGALGAAYSYLNDPFFNIDMEVSMRTFARHRRDIRSEIKLLEWIIQNCTLQRQEKYWVEAYKKWPLLGCSDELRKKYAHSFRKLDKKYIKQYRLIILELGIPRLDVSGLQVEQQASPNTPFSAAQMAKLDEARKKCSEVSNQLREMMSQYELYRSMSGGIERVPDLLHLHSDPQQHQQHLERLCVRIAELKGKMNECEVFKMNIMRLQNLNESLLKKSNPSDWGDLHVSHDDSLWSYFVQTADDYNKTWMPRLMSLFGVNNPTELDPALNVAGLPNMQAFVDKVLGGDIEPLKNHPDIPQAEENAKKELLFANLADYVKSKTTGVPIQSSPPLGAVEPVVVDEIDIVSIIEQKKNEIVIEAMQVLWAVAPFIICPKLVVGGAVVSLLANRVNRVIMSGPSRLAPIARVVSAVYRLLIGSLVSQDLMHYPCEERADSLVPILSSRKGQITFLSLMNLASNFYMSLPAFSGSRNGMTFNQMWTTFITADRVSNQQMLTTLFVIESIGKSAKDYPGSHISSLLATLAFHFGAGGFIRGLTYGQVLYEYLTEAQQQVHQEA